MTLAQRARAFLPERARERARLELARRAEDRLRASDASVGAALVFHEVVDRPVSPETQIDPPIEAPRLEAVVAHLVRGYRLVRASELPTAVGARQAGEPIPIAITFDDDLSSHRDLALPVLERHGSVATVFLCGVDEPFWWRLLQAAIDRPALAPEALAEIPRDVVEAALDRRPSAAAHLAKAVEDLPPSSRDHVAATLRRAVGDHPPMLGLDGAKALADAGWEIGFHTREHHVMSRLGDDALRDALVDGRDALAGGRPRAFAYPHGKAGEREARAAEAAGYSVAFTGEAAPMTADTDVHRIGRLQPDASTPGRFALQLIRSLAAADGRAT